MKGTQAAVALSTIAPLLFIDANFIRVLVGSGILAKATTLELVVFSLQFGKSGVLVAFGRFRAASMAFLVDVYGAELLVLPVLLIVYLAFHVPGMPQLAVEVVRGWIVGVSIAGLLYSAARLGIGMVRSESLTTVMPLGMVTVELGVLLTGGTSAASAAHAGLAGVATFTFFQRGSVSAASPYVFAAVAVVYVSLLLYGVLGWDPQQSVERNRAIALAAGATAAAAALIYSASLTLLPIDLVVIPPTLAAVASAWWIAHGN